MPTNRRGFLSALALAPAAVAACSTGAAAGKPALRPGKTPRARGDASATPAAEGKVSAVRGFALRGGAEPAFTFRASVARPGER
jgi:hypothetical protein